MTEAATLPHSTHAGSSPPVPPLPLLFVECYCGAYCHRLVHRVQLPPEGKTIMLGWDPSGAVLAVVQKLGGAFLWSPSKPESVRQWEGQQFSSSTRRDNAVRPARLQPCNPTLTEAAAVCSLAATTTCGQALLPYVVCAGAAAQPPL